MPVRAGSGSVGTERGEHTHVAALGRAASHQVACTKFLHYDTNMTFDTLTMHSQSIL